MRYAAFLILVLTAIAACSTPAGDRETLEQSIKLYNSMLQWQETNNASLFVAAKQLNDFIAAADAAKNKRIVEARPRITMFDEMKKEAEVRVEFDYYHKTDNKLRTAVDVQKWVFVTEGKEAHWKLASPYPVLP